MLYSNKKIKGEKYDENLQKDIDNLKKNLKEKADYTGLKKFENTMAKIEREKRFVNFYDSNYKSVKQEDGKFKYKDSFKQFIKDLRTKTQKNIKKSGNLTEQQKVENQLYKTLLNKIDKIKDKTIDVKLVEMTSPTIKQLKYKMRDSGYSSKTLYITSRIIMLAPAAMSAIKVLREGFGGEPSPFINREIKESYNNIVDGAIKALDTKINILKINRISKNFINPNQEKNKKI